MILVHGTKSWKDRLLRRNPSWLENGPLRNALKDAGHAVATFTWSGWNSHHARRSATEDLVKFLAGHAHCGNQIWILAHSHGGNVTLHAIDALRNGGVNTDRLKIVTLATPFLHARESRPGLRAATAAVLTGASGVVAILNVFAPIAQLDYWTFLLSCVLAVGTVAQVGLVLLGMALHGCWLDGSRRSAFTASIHAPAAGPEFVAAARAASDEASGIIGTGQFLAWLGVGAAQIFTPIVGAIAVFVSAVSAIGILSTGWQTGAVTTWLCNGYLAIVLSTLFALLAFGWDGPYAVLFAKVSAEATPPGNSTVWQFQPLSGAGREHSKLQSDPKIKR